MAGRAADMSKGVGAVYFGKTKIDPDDILVAELSAGACTKQAKGDVDTKLGSFFVTGD